MIRNRLAGLFSSHVERNGHSQQQRRGDDREYRQLVDSYVRRNVLKVEAPELYWPNVVDAVRELGKSIDQFAVDWREAERRIRREYPDL